jgi:hypothetical protein
MKYSSISEAALGADLIAVLVCHNSIRLELAELGSAVKSGMRHDRIIFFDA